MKKKAIILILLGFIFLDCFSCFGQERKEEKNSTDSKISSLQKSLLIPGWGQLAEKRYLEGILFLSAEAFCLYNIISDNHKGNKNYALYKKASFVDDAVKYRELTEKYDARRNKFLLAAAGVWAINLIDIYVIVKNKSNKGRNIRLSLEIREDQELAFAVSCHF